MRFLLVLCLLLGAWGCGPADSALKGTTTSDLLGGKQSGDFGLKLADAEARWANRGDQEALEEAISLWETAIEIETPQLTPEERKAAIYGVYVRLARAHYLLADAVLPHSEGGVSKERQALLFDRGRDYAERAMGVYSAGFLEAVKGGATVGDAAMAHLDAGAVGAMFWWATDLGRWLTFQGGLKALGYLDDMESVSHHAYRVDRAFFFHSPASYLGGYYTRLPLPGGDMAKSKQRFEEAIAGAPGCLQHQVAYAEHYAVAKGDRALFRSTLEGVIAATGGPAELGPENAHAKEAAKRLLAREGSLF